ncbi:PhzF family phenazine biosynthesis protein [Glutamicibacter ardleyensis]|uniref:PhzF family phenazine biosynthesis protein n=1 Tax=Glutamicibacter ardleyensis TaxID=225894 RepID=UPI003F8F9D8B
MALNLDPVDLGSLTIGAVGPHEPGRDANFEVRAFIGGDPVWEDPVTGSLNAALARWMIESKTAGQHYIAAQGTAIGYHGRAHIDC